MTKRMLSLLLALVMTLSLCVPALAAGDFAAEAVTEVEEQAPVDPVVEEVVADEPVAAAIVADEPQTIANVLNKAALQEAVNAANKIKAAVEAGEYQKADGSDPKAEFTDWLTKSVDCLNGVLNGNYYDYTQNDIDWRTNGLSTILQDITNETIQGQKDVLAVTFTSYFTNITSGDYDDVLRPDYLAECKTALAAVKAAIASGLYKDYKVAAKYWADLGSNFFAANQYGTGNSAGFDAAFYANWEDAIALQKAANDALALIASGEYAHPENIKPDGTRTLKELCEDIVSLIDLSQPNGFNSTYTCTYQRYSELMEYIADGVEDLTKNSYTVKIVSAGVRAGYAQIAVGFTYGDYTADTHNYSLKATVNGATSNELLVGTNVIPTNGNDDNRSTAIGTSANKDQTRWLYLNASDFKTIVLAKFAEGSTVTFTLTDKDTGAEVQTYPFVVTEYNGPVFAKGTYSPNSFTLALDKTLNYANGSEAYYKNAKVTAVGPDGKKFGGTVDIAGTDLSVTFSTVPTAVGDYTFNLAIEQKKANGEYEKVASADTITVNVPAVTAYASDTPTTANPYGNKGYTNMTKALAAAKTKTELVGKAGMTTVQAREILKLAIDDADSFVAKAATTPNTTANQAVVDAKLKALKVAIGNMTEGADPSKLEAAVEAGDAAVTAKADYDTTSVTGAANWSAFETALKNAKAAAAKLPAPKSEQTNLNNLAKALEDAIKALVVKVATAEIATLKALVESVPSRLAADDYTAESKAAVNTATTAANAVLAKSAPRISEVNKAIADLQAALAALATAPKGPQPPAGGTGWAQYNGLWYYFVNNVMKKDYWVTNGSAHDLWYHMGSDGTLDTGFQYIEDKTFGHGWFMLQATDTNGMLGAMLTSWQDTGIAGMGWFVPSHNGHYGECTWTNAHVR